MRAAREAKRAAMRSAQAARQSAEAAKTTARGLKAMAEAAAHAVKAWLDFDHYDGDFRVPESWKLYYKEGESWKEVEALTEYTVKKDCYNSLDFKPVKTKGLKSPGRNGGMEQRHLPAFETGRAGKGQKLCAGYCPCGAGL